MGWTWLELAVAVGPLFANKISVGMAWKRLELAEIG